MAIFRIAAAVGVLYLVAPQVPQAVIGALPNWSGSAVPTSEQASAAAMRYCADNPASCAKLLRGVTAASGHLPQAAALQDATSERPAEPARKPRKPRSAAPEHEAPKLRP
jgi:hypothetical protein